MCERDKKLTIFLFFVERYNQTMMDMYNLFLLSVCQVCGSYQCPYCPVFSSSFVGAISVHLILLCTLVPVLVNRRVCVWD